MQEGTTAAIAFPSESAQDVLSEILRDGAQRMLALAVEADRLQEAFAAYTERLEGNYPFFHPRYGLQRGAASAEAPLPGHARMRYWKRS